MNRWCQRCGDVPPGEVLSVCIPGVRDGTIIYRHEPCGFEWPRYGADVPHLHRAGLQHIEARRRFGVTA